MIDQFTGDDLLKLVRLPNEPCVTIYLPTKKTGREIYQPATILGQLAKQAVSKIAGNWMSHTQAEKFLEPIMCLTSDNDFWQQSELGLALFLDADSLRKWRVAQAFAPQVFVSKQFFVRPMIAPTNRETQFFILSLDQNKSQLFQANKSDIAKVEVADMPVSIEAALNLASAERGSQVHTGSREFGGKQSSVFHGHGGKSETAKKDLLQYYRLVDAAITKHLRGKQQPLMLACVESQVPIYREANTYPNLIDQVVIGGTGQLTPHQLHTRSLPYMQDYNNRIREVAIGSYREQANTDRSLSEVSAVVAAAYQGRIETLLVDETASIPGEFNSFDNTIDYDESSDDFDKDIVEAAINQTLLHRGDVLTLSRNEMPVEAPMVATLRY